MIFLGLLLLIPGFYFVTGRSAPDYPYLGPRDRFEAAGRTWTAAEAAARFVPRVRAAPGVDLPETVYFQTLAPEGERVRVLYVVAWPDEAHPLVWIHYPYRLWRQIYFGDKKDLEYVWVLGDLRSGLSEKIAFESPTVGRVLVEHRPRVLERGGFKAEEGHPSLQVVSWNHLFELGGEGSAPPEPALEFLSEGLYRHFKMERRSLPQANLLRKN